MVLLIILVFPTGELSFECKECSKVFENKKVLDNHLRVHVRQKLHKCDICNKSFGTRQILTRHKGTHTGTQKENLQVLLSHFPIYFFFLKFHAQSPFCTVLFLSLWVFNLFICMNYIL